MLWNAATPPQGTELRNSRRTGAGQSEAGRSHTTDSFHWRVENSQLVRYFSLLHQSPGHWLLLYYWGAPPPPPPPPPHRRGPGPRCTWHTSRCQSASPAIFIVVSPQPWYEQRGGGTSKAHLPVSSQVARLFGGARASESQKRGLERSVWIPGRDACDGLIVAPSGHRHTSQRAADEELQRLEKTPASFLLHLLDFCTWLSDTFDFNSLSRAYWFQTFPPPNTSVFLSQLFPHLLRCTFQFSLPCEKIVNLATPLSCQVLRFSHE